MGSQGTLSELGCLGVGYKLCILRGVGGVYLPRQSTTQLNHCFSGKSHHPLAGCFCGRLCSHLCCVPSWGGPIHIRGNICTINPEGQGRDREGGGEHLLWKRRLVLSLTPHMSSEVCPRVADSLQPCYSRLVSLCW